LAALGWFADEGLVRVVAHVLLQVFDFVRHQEGVRHKAEINREESLQSANDYTEDVLLREVLKSQKAKTYIHERVPVNEVLLLFNEVDVVVPEGDSVPEEMALGVGSALTIAVLVDHVLHSVYFGPTIESVNKNVLPLVSLVRHVYTKGESFQLLVLEALRLLYRRGD